MSQPDTTDAQVAPPGGAQESGESPKKLKVVCDTCGDELLVNAERGIQYHKGGEPVDEHPPAPRAAGK